MATRIGSARKAKHIELKHLFIQQLISNDFAKLIQIHTSDNPADILTKHLNRDSATTPTTSRTWHPATQPSLKQQSNSFTICSLQQAGSNISILCSVRAHQNIHISHFKAMGSTTVDQTLCCNDIPLSISTQIFDMYYINVWGPTTSSKFSCPTQHVCDAQHVYFVRGLKFNLFCQHSDLCSF